MLAVASLGRWTWAVWEMWRAGRGRKPTNSIPLWLVLQFPYPGFQASALSLASVDDGLLAARWKKHFYPKPPMLMMFITATGKQTRTVPMLNPSLCVLISLCVLSATLPWNAITSLRKYLSNHSIKPTPPTAWIRRPSIVKFELFATSSMGYKRS